MFIAYQPGYLNVVVQNYMAPSIDSLESAHNLVVCILGPLAAIRYVLYVYRDMLAILQMLAIWCVLWFHCMIHI